MTNERNSEAMTREEAIILLEFYKTLSSHGLCDDLVNALDMAITALRSFAETAGSEPAKVPGQDTFFRHDGENVWEGETK